MPTIITTIEEEPKKIMNELRREQVRKESTRYKVNQESEKLIVMTNTPQFHPELDFDSSQHLLRGNSKFSSRNQKFEERQAHRLSDFEKHFIDFSGKTQYLKNGSYPSHIMELSRSVVNGTRCEESREAVMYVTTTQTKEKREVQKIIAERHYKAHQRQKAAALLRAKMLNESAVVRNLVVTNTSHHEINRPHSKSTSNRELWISRFKEEKVQICSPFYQRDLSNEKQRAVQSKIPKIPKRKLMSLVRTKAATQLGDLPKEGTGILMIKKLESMKPPDPKPTKRFMMTHRKQLRVVSMVAKKADFEGFREHTTEY